MYGNGHNMVLVMLKECGSSEIIRALNTLEDHPSKINWVSLGFYIISNLVATTIMKKSMKW